MSAGWCERHHEAFLPIEGDGCWQCDEQHERALAERREAIERMQDMERMQREAEKG